MAVQDIYKDFQNDEFAVTAAGTEIEIIFDRKADIGTDGANTRYMSFRNSNAARRVVIRSDKQFSITEINGKVLKSGISVTANGSFTIRDDVSINKFKILTGAATALVHVFAVA